MTIEDVIAREGFPLGEKIGETRKIRDGTFGPDGELIRIAVFEDAVLLEMNGVTARLFVDALYRKEGVEAHA